MNIITHAFAGWTLSLPFELDRRDRALVVFASVAPDLDSAVLLGDLAKGRPLDQCELFATYHHVIGHNVLFAALVTLACVLLARRKVFIGGLALFAVHFHLLCDIVGSRGPDGSQWEIPYLLPFSNAWHLAVDWQWALNAWPNILFTVVLLAVTLSVAWSRGLSPVGLLSRRADRAVVATLRARFGEPKTRRDPCSRGR
jgi:inner membrane protein